MTKLNCRECGRMIAALEDSQIVVRYKDLVVKVERGEVGCPHYVRKRQRADGAWIYATCGVLTFVEAPTPVVV